MQDERDGRGAVGSRRAVHDPDGLNTGIWPVATAHLVTPTDLFFTRSHAAIPSIDPQTWRLELSGLVERPGSFSLTELASRFPKRDVVATLVCAGLRREEFLSLGALPGELPWGPEPISTGRWGGISLGNLLRSAGIADKARHVELVGLDRVERHEAQFGFGGSIEIAKALSDEVLLATELNGAPIPPQHGFPLRAVVPGWIGARSVKWLGRVALLEEPSLNYFQSKAYRLQREITPADPRDVTAGVALSAIPLNSVIIEPLSKTVSPRGWLKVAGWAIGSAGRPLKTVELSSDAGKTWKPARLAVEGERWAWSFWEGEVRLPPGHHQLAVRATDTVGTTQPALVRDTWNVKGYNNNAWHRVDVVAE